MRFIINYYLLSSQNSKILYEKVCEKYQNME